MKTLAIVMLCLVVGGCASKACQGSRPYTGQISTLHSPAPVHQPRVPRSGLTTGGQLYYSDGDVMTIWKQDGSTDYIYNQGR